MLFQFIRILPCADSVQCAMCGSVGLTMSSRLMLLSAIKTMPVAKHGIQPKGQERRERWERVPEGRHENVFWHITLATELQSKGYSWGYDKG